MADAGSLVKKYLDPNRISKRWNLYTVLGLEELLDDRTMIAVAVDAAINKLKAADRTTDPESFEQIVKIVRQARGTLLDDEKKAAYDKQLAAVLAKANGGATSDSAPSKSDLVRLQSVLPSGDPTAPFSMSEYLQQATPEAEQESVADRQFALMELALQSSTPAPVANASKPTTATMQPPTTGLPMGTRSGSNSAAKQLQAQIRRNRQRKNMIASSVVLGVAMLIIGLSVLMYLKNRPQAGEAIAANQQPEPSTAERRTIREKHPRIAATMRMLKRVERRG